MTTCCVDDCMSTISPKSARGMCSLHYSRWRRLGSTELPPRMKDQSCSVQGCETPARKLGLCSSHYSRQRLYGDLKITYRWQDAGGECSWCGVVVSLERGRSRYCSEGCKALSSQRRNTGQTKRASRDCSRCGSAIPMEATGRSGRRRREDVLTCAVCRRARGKRHGSSVAVLALRDGTDCGICGEPVDMTLRMPDLMSASVDHIFPFARGGSHDPSNLQLAHNICNRRKSARTDVAGQSTMAVM